MAENTKYNQQPSHGGKFNKNALLSLYCADGALMIWATAEGGISKAKIRNPSSTYEVKMQDEDKTTKDLAENVYEKNQEALKTGTGFFTTKENKLSRIENWVDNNNSDFKRKYITLPDYSKNN